MKVKTCKHSIFDGQWGEYKCKKRERRIQDTSDCEKCKMYRQKRNKKQGV